MKLLTILIVIIHFSVLNPAFADELKSTNYKIIDADTNPEGEITKSTNFDLLSTINNFTGDPRIYSANYRLGIANVEIFTAKVPKISCFETDSNGTSDCTTGPSYLNTNGMVTVCGNDGCYDRARLEIDPQNNPADTLYGIQVSTDNFASETMYIDGTTYQPKDSSTKTISDYKTKTEWETATFNLMGLFPSTEYKARLTALHGDFTESEPGPTATATTSEAILSFDIDIADINGVSEESPPPYSVSFTDPRKIIQTGPPQTAEKLIWFDTETNAAAGYAILIKGEYGGLYSSTETYNIESVQDDLDGITEGYGLQNYFSTQTHHLGSGNGELSIIETIPTYGQSGNIVGIVSTIFTKIYESEGPIMNGRIGTFIKARASSTTPPATDYSENITVLINPRY